jgi:Protein of unknown function DUF2617
MDFEYQHHFSNDLQETIASGRGKFSTELLQPLFIVSKAHWKIGKFKIDAYVLAASHAVVIEFENEIFIQVIACNYLKNDGYFEFYDQRSLNGKTEKLEKSIQNWQISSTVSSHNENRGKSLFEDHHFEWRLDKSFPGEGNPSTSIGITEKNGRVEVYSIHSYPLEKVTVNSHLSIKNTYHQD